MRARSNGLILIKARRRLGRDSCRRQSKPYRRGTMIICSCNVLSDHDVRSIAAAPAAPRTAAEVYGCLGCSPACGRCARTIRQIVADATCGAGSAAR